MDKTMSALDKLCADRKCDPAALTCAVAEADSGDPATLEQMAERWDVPVAALSAGITARRRWRARRGEPAVVFESANVVVAS